MTNYGCPPYAKHTVTPYSYSQYNYSSSSQYAPTYPRQPQYAHKSTLQPLSNHASSPMSRGYSNGSASSSSGRYSDSTAASSPPDYPDPPSPDIEVVYTTAASSKHKQSKTLKPLSISQPSHSRSNNRPAEYPCLYSGCSHISGRPFDLDRHMKKHNPPSPEDKHDCPGKGCGRVGVHGFDRKDHMTEHLRNYHMWDIPKAAGRGGKSSGGKRRA